MLGCHQVWLGARDLSSRQRYWQWDWYWFGYPENERQIEAINKQISLPLGLQPYVIIIIIIITNTFVKPNAKSSKGVKRKMKHTLIERYVPQVDYK